MTKSELFIMLENAGWTVEINTEEELQEYGDLTQYKVYVHKEVNDVLTGQWIYFWLDGSSNAFWHGVNPTTIVSAFVQDVETYMTTKMGDANGDFVAWFFETINNEEEYATIHGYTVQGSNIEEDKYVIDYDSTPELQHRKIT